MCFWTSPQHLRHSCSTFELLLRHARGGQTGKWATHSVDMPLADNKQQTETSMHLRSPAHKVLPQTSARQIWRSTGKAGRLALFSVHLRDENTEAWWNDLACPRSDQWKPADWNSWQRLKPRCPGPNSKHSSVIQWCMGASKLFLQLLGPYFWESFRELLSALWAAAEVLGQVEMWLGHNPCTSCQRVLVRLKCVKNI